MNEFLEYEKTKKTIKSLNLDDFSVEDLEEYIGELKNELIKAQMEIKKKSDFKSKAEEFFK